MKNLKNLVVGFTALIIFTACLVKPAAAATRIDGISIETACQQQYNSKYHAYLVGKTVLDWYCVVLSADKRYFKSVQTVNLNKECQRAYGSAAYADNTDYNNPYSWSCYKK